MNKAILIIGVVLIVWGLWIVFRPGTVRTMIQFFSKGLLVYVPAAVRVILGVVFLVSARECRFPWVIGAFGIVMFSAGVIMFMIKPSKLRPLFQWWADRSLIFIRIIGLLGAAVGGLIAWAV